ncbi:hypothetical protein NSE01_30490 [Novosphingobium sediminis]|uniref:Uncharacterized protein n=1 Tax=Novosphingobium sediminis TaxID=707214 RepID=A0A512ANP4_9SPHN|nr:hypothetical protein [Novosphingobium sediminis]GEO01217.1 hypothetical protein NSE01_30490 [Novosphingobium sediminis]
MITTLIFLAAAAQSVEADPVQPLYVDAQLGKQMSVEEMKRDLVGSSFAFDSPEGRNAFYVAEGGVLKGVMPKGGAFAINWRFREYDNLFCFETGDVASSGCVQMIRDGEKVSVRRKDGLVEFTATIAPGNAFNL